MYRLASQRLLWDLGYHCIHHVIGFSPLHLPYMDRVTSQRLLWDLGYRIGFSTPWVTQFRNAHNYLADFNSELPLYQQAGALVDALLDWKPRRSSALEH